MEALSKEIPVVFHVEAIGEGTYQHAPEDPADGLMEAKLAYFHFSSRCVQEGAVLLLHFTDSNRLLRADKPALPHNIPANTTPNALLKMNLLTTPKLLPTTESSASVHRVIIW